MPFRLALCLGAVACTLLAQGEENRHEAATDRLQGLSYTLATKLYLQTDQAKGAALTVETEKTITTVERKDRGHTIQRVTYGRMERRGSAALGRREKEAEAFPPVAGKTYLVELKDEEVKVRDEQGAKPPGEEREFVEDEFKRQIKLRKKMEEKREARKEEREGEEEVRREALKVARTEGRDLTDQVETALCQRLEDEGLKVEECSIERQEPREVEGVRCLVFALHLAAGKGSWLIGDAHADLKGEAIVPVGLDVPFSLKLEGPTSMTPKKGLLRLRKGEEKEGYFKLDIAVKLNLPEGK